MRDPYQNVDLEKLVQEHYGVTGYDPKAALPTFGGAKVNEGKGAAAEGVKDSVQVPNLQKAASLPVPGSSSIQYLVVNGNQ